MEISVEFKGYSQSFRTMIVGVTKKNADGTDRQALISQLHLGELLSLVRERNNPYDKYAVAVFTTSCQQLGYVPAGDRRLADHIDMGGGVSARVARILHGHPILGIFFSSLWKTRGCVIEISKQGFDWKEVTPYIDESRKIEELIKNTRSLEEKDVADAILMYREIVAQIIAFDKAGPLAASWRRARYPINRLSLLLEKGGRLQDALDEILRYEQFDDVFGLISEDAKSVTTRKLRLSKKLKIKQES
jgi:hypothetical protein